ncbi:MAG: hypothetical protein PUC75_07045 [Lachnospiraceae bacterium]|jgi:hypothetical protein|nr:hypothetical protein [Lachnospiraceae bacterium]
MALKFTDIKSAEEVYDEIKVKIESGKGFNKAEAYSQLTQIMNDLPGTWIAGFAKDLRDKL